MTEQSKPHVEGYGPTNSSTFHVYECSEGDFVARGSDGGEAKVEAHIAATHADGKPAKTSAPKAEKPAAAVAGPSFKELQAEASALGIKPVGLNKAALEAAIAAANGAKPS